MDTPTAQVAAIVRQVIIEATPSADVSGAWCAAGSRGGVLVRWHYAGEVHVVTTYRIQFDLSGPSPSLVPAPVPRIVPPLSRAWSAALGSCVEQRQHIEPIAVRFRPLTAA